MGVVAVVVGVGSLVVDSIARLRHRSDAHREAPASIDAPMVVPAFEFEDELERLLASAGRRRARLTGTSTGGDQLHRIEVHAAPGAGHSGPMTSASSVAASASQCARARPPSSGSSCRTTGRSIAACIGLTAR